MWQLSSSRHIHQYRHVMRRTKSATAAARAAAAAAEAASSDGSEMAQSPGKSEKIDRVSSELRIKEMLKELHQLIQQVQVTIPFRIC